MKNWFPFTDYDFYAYLASGSLLIAAFDLALNAGALIDRRSWTVIAIALWVAGAYVTGHLIALASSQLLEHGLARGLLAPPAQILLGLKKPTLIERAIGTLVGRYYAPLDDGVRDKILSVAAAVLNKLPTALSAEEVFQVAHRASIGTDHVRDRCATFRNQYGFCRNIALVGAIASVIFVGEALLGARHDLWGWSIVAIVVALGMTARFLKFYAAFAAEVLRTLLK